MKDLCREVGCTLNDYTSTLLSITLYEYMERRSNQYEIPETINISSAFSMRAPVEKTKDIEMTNQSTGVLV